MHDLAERYTKRSEMLLRLIDPEDLGHLVDHEARVLIARCLGLVSDRIAAPEPVSAFKEPVHEHDE